MKAHVNHHLLIRGATESKHNDFGEMAVSVFVQPAYTRSATEMMGLDLHITYLNISGHIVKEGHYCDIIVYICAKTPGLKAGTLWNNIYRASPSDCFSRHRVKCFYQNKNVHHPISPMSAAGQLLLMVAEGMLMLSPPYNLCNYLLRKLSLKLRLLHQFHHTEKHRRPFIIKFSHLFVDEDSGWVGKRPAGVWNRKETEDRTEEAITPIVQGVTLHLNVTRNFSPEGSNRSANNNNPFLWEGSPVYCFNNRPRESSARKSQLPRKN